MKKLIGSLTIVYLFALASFAQPGTAPKTGAADKSAAAAPNAAMDTAKLVLAAHGGDKLRKLTSFVQKGSADLTFMGQAIPGAFSMAFSGEKYYFEITSAVQSLKQIYDGNQTYSSLPGFSLPPITSLGFPLLPRIGDTGYVISALVEDKKKRKGFRMTTPEGFYTDFYVDEKTNQIKGYESKYDVNGTMISTSVEIDEFQTVDGIVVPKK